MDNKKTKSDIKIERILDMQKIDSYYSTCAFIRTTVQDFSLCFGNSIHDDLNEKVIEVYEKMIRMSPQQTKIFFIALKSLLDNYENTFGEINIDAKKE